MNRGPLHVGSPLLMLPVFAEDSKPLGYLRLNEKGIAYFKDFPEAHVLSLRVDATGKLSAVRVYSRPTWGSWLKQCWRPNEGERKENS